MLTCEEMPDDLDPQSSRRLLDMGVPGSYGDAPSSGDGPRTPSLVLGSGCDTCAPMFGQCGEHGDVVSCCGAGLQCTKKNKFFGTTYFLVTALCICMGYKMIVSTDKKVYDIPSTHSTLIASAAQCITPERAARNMERLGWDGEELTCGQIIA